MCQKAMRFPFTWSALCREKGPIQPGKLMVIAIEWQNTVKSLPECFQVDPKKLDFITQFLLF